MRVTQVYLETHTRRQHCSLPLHHQQPLSFSSITWFHKLTRGNKWVMSQTQTHCLTWRDSSLLKNLKNQVHLAPCYCKFLSLDFALGAPLLTKAHMTTHLCISGMFVNVTLGAGWSLALHAHSQEWVWLPGRALLVATARDGGMQADGAVRGGWGLVPLGTQPLSARSTRTLGPLFSATYMRRKHPTECPWHGLALCSLLAWGRAVVIS